MINNKTCKQLGPKLKQRKMAEDDFVIREYEKTKNTLRKRVDKAENYIVAERSMQYDEYCSWREMASLAKMKYLSGEISAEDAIEIFHDYV